MPWYITVWLISFDLIRSVDYRSGIGSFSKRGSYFLLMKTYHKRLVQSIIHSLVVLKWNFRVQIDQRLQVGIKTIKRIIECIWKTISSIQQRSRVNFIQRSHGGSRSSGGDKKYIAGSILQPILIVKLIRLKLYRPVYTDL